MRFLALLLVVVLAGCAAQPPKPREIDAPAWHVGDSWKYRVENQGFSDNSPKSGTWKVTGVDAKVGGHEIYDVHETRSDGTQKTQRMYKSNLSLVGEKGNAIPGFAFPLTPGKRWHDSLGSQTAALRVTEMGVLEGRPYAVVNATVDAGRVQVWIVQVYDATDRNRAVVEVRAVGVTSTQIFGDHGPAWVDLVRRG